MARLILVTLFLASVSALVATAGVPVTDENSDLQLKVKNKLTTEKVKPFDKKFVDNESERQAAKKEADQLAGELARLVDSLGQAEQRVRRIRDSGSEAEKENLKVLETQLETLRTDLGDHRTKTAAAQQRFRKARDAKEALTLEKTKAVEEVQQAVEALKNALNNLKLESRFDQLKLDNLSLAEKLTAIERKFDQTVVAAYLREKLTHLTKDIICKKDEVCKTPANIDKAMNGIFYNAKGKLGRTQAGGEAPASH